MEFSRFHVAFLSATADRNRLVTMLVTSAFVAASLWFLPSVLRGDLLTDGVSQGGLASTTGSPKKRGKKKDGAKEEDRVAGGDVNETLGGKGRLPPLWNRSRWLNLFDFLTGNVTRQASTLRCLYSGTRVYYLQLCLFSEFRILCEIF
jgi:hypothetical protein